jgi:hypothetical protein
MRISETEHLVQTPQRDFPQCGDNARGDEEFARASWECTKQTARIAAEDAKQRAPDQAAEINRLLRVFVTSEPPADMGALDMKHLALTGLLASFQVLFVNSMISSQSD